MDYPYVLLVEGFFFFPDEKSEVLEAEPQNKGMTS
jgi:hypothetical protein